MTTPTERYRDEFKAACEWSERHGLDAAPPPAADAPDYVDWEIAGPLLERLLAPYADQEIASGAAAINYFLLPHLSKACGCDFMITLGWIETPHYRIFKHDQRLPERLLMQRGGARRELSMHVWLTSPAHEIIDVTLPLRLASAADGDPARPIFYLSGADTESLVTYHPTVVGGDFLLRIDAITPPDSLGFSRSRSPANALRSN